MFCAAGEPLGVTVTPVAMGACGVGNTLLAVAWPSLCTASTAVNVPVVGFGMRNEVMRSAAGSCTVTDAVVADGAVTVEPPIALVPVAPEVSVNVPDAVPLS